VSLSSISGAYPGRRADVVCRGRARARAADAAHPAFSNLFVQTECVPELDVVLATRRPRSADEPRLWLAHVVAVEGETVGALQWETDRARFLGRGRGVRRPLAQSEGRALSNTVGSVLDPIVSLRRRVRIPPGAAVRVSFSTMVAPSREEALTLAEKYRDAVTFDRAATLAWTRAQVQLHHLGIGPDEAHLFQSLARRALFLDGRSGPPGICSRVRREARRLCGPTGSRGISRSSSCRSTSPTTWASCGSSSAPTSTGG
jgi:Cellobiose phosphorylase